jgi:sugar (pentulose or hexulose) kinase
MREILFRGKSLDNRGAWVLGSLIHRTDFYGDPCDDYFILYGGEFDCDYYDADRVDPETVGQLTAVIYNSLAKCYADCANEIEEFTGKKYPAINIIGGGSNADYLNRITAKTSGRTVLAGPSEATAIGNLMAQMLSVGSFKDLADARECVIRSFGIKTYN